VCSFQLPGASSDFLEERALGLRGLVGIPRGGACGRIQQGGGISDRARQGVLVDDAAGHVAEQRRKGVARACGLQAEHAAA
jgi:hypothetical protein